MHGRDGASQAANDEYSEEIMAALGPKGVPLSIDEALASVNADNYGKGTAYMVNCQRVIYAYEMARRGYDVEALPRQKGTDDTAMHWKEIMEGAQWQGVNGKTRAKVAQELSDRMAEWGVGARAAIYIKWARGKNAHVFNVEQTKDGPVYIEAQSGKRIDIADYMANASPQKTMICRLDTLQPSARITGCMQPKKGK